MGEKGRGGGSGPCNAANLRAAAHAASAWQLLLREREGMASTGVGSCRVLLAVNRADPLVEGWSFLPPAVRAALHHAPPSRLIMMCFFPRQEKFGHGSAAQAEAGKKGGDIAKERDKFQGRGGWGRRVGYCRV